MPSAHCAAGLKPARLRSEKLAAAIGVTVTTYYRYEAGARRLYLDKACVLADTMGISLDDIRRDPGTGTVDAGAALDSWVVE